MKSELNPMYLASDVFKCWEDLISCAKEDVTIFSPYLDVTIIDLVKKAPNVFPSHVKIITDLNPASLLESPAQLHTIKHALSLQIPFFTLKDLHAKILVVDGKFITVGSQNFTKKGRRNKEASVVNNKPLEDSVFVNKLSDWIDQAEPIDESLIDSLIAELSDKCEEYTNLLKETSESLSRVINDHNAKKHEAVVEKFLELEESSKFKMQEGSAFCRLKPNKDGGYKTLKASYGWCFTNWIQYNSDGNSQVYNVLERLYMYPMIVAETLQMCVARLGKRQITHVDDEIKYSDPFVLGSTGLSVEVTLNFPSTRTKTRNITIYFKTKDNCKCKIDVLFTGLFVLKIIETKFTRSKDVLDSQYQYFVSSTLNCLTNDTNCLENLLSDCFKRFKWNRLEFHHNIKNLVKDMYSYKLSLFEWNERPILLLSKLPWR